MANLAVGTLFGWSLVAAPATADVGAPPATGPAVFAAAIAVFTLALLGMGPALRSLGPRRLLAGAAVAAGAGLLVAATGQHPLALWLGIGLIFGAAGGVGYGVSVGLAARAPDAHRGTATGLVVGAYAVGPVLLGLLAPAAEAAFGWRSCLAGLALVVVGLLVVAAVLAPPDRARPRELRTEQEPLPRRTVVLLWVVFAGGAAPGLLVFAAAVPLATGRSLTPGAAGAAVSSLAAGNLAGRLISGWWSDRVGRLPALAAGLAVAATAVAGLAGPPAPWLVLGSFAGTGLAYGAVSALVPAATADRVGVRAFPRAYGRVFTAWGCAGLAAPIVGGALVGADSERPALVLTAAVTLLPAAVALLLLGRRPPSRPAGTGSPPA
jgi:OFA family oxalate/formate antiporter-like MFS transporter